MLDPVAKPANRGGSPVLSENVAGDQQFGAGDTRRCEQLLESMGVPVPDEVQLMRVVVLRFFL